MTEGSGQQQRRRPPQRQLRLQHPPRAGTRRRPPRREVSDRDRGLAVAGVAVLLVIGVIAVISLFTIGGDDDPAPSGVSEETTDRAEGTPTPRPTPTPTPEPRLTPEERRARTAARATVRAQGFRPVGKDTWAPQSQLRVILGEAQPSSGLRGRKAFFFLGDDYLGTDAESASTKLSFVRQGDVTVTLRYGIFEPDDPVCCPEGEPVTVRFRWNGSALTPLDVIPAAELRLR